MKPNNLSNWIEDSNRFNLSKPPTWFLDKLREFDDSLVIVPSRQSALYRLAQRRPLTLPNHIINDVLFNDSDTKMLASLSLVPVTTIIPNPHWSDSMFHELAMRAPWRQGGADKVIKEVEELDYLKEARKRVATSNNLVDRSKDGWKLYQAKTGARSFISATKQRAWIR